MKTLRTPQQVREGINHKNLSSTDRIPVIVTIPISKNKQDLGIQFWTAEMIKEKTAINPDKTISKLIELY